MTQQALQELDHLFLSILEELAEHARNHAAESAHQVFSISQGYLSEAASVAMEDFFNIYFSESQHIEQSKVDVNNDVDDLFDEIQAIMDSGGDLSQIDLIEEDESLKEARLGLAGIQRQLETIIRLEEGIREKLMPVLVSMQFEDAMDQRLKHILNGWRMITSSLHHQESDDFSVVAELVARLCSSVDESTLYYQELFGTPPPKGSLSHNASLLDLFS